MDFMSNLGPTGQESFATSMNKYPATAIRKKYNDKGWRSKPFFPSMASAPAFNPSTKSILKTQPKTRRFPANLPHQ
ncbi:unnamed protein product [Allacma fusca]|uniref:Uncharacterized protein n=1 Tax=Allacma fusca TaxID=39272 RepID=A0A8J2PL04_9HEXA|nr:unnamed protein product [Allacma fusca]